VWSILAKKEPAKTCPVDFGTFGLQLPQDQRTNKSTTQFYFIIFWIQMDGIRKFIQIWKNACIVMKSALVQIFDLTLIYRKYEGRFST